MVDASGARPALAEAADTSGFALNSAVIPAAADCPTIP
jgi:hypothetical protein